MKSIIKNLLSNKLSAKEKQYVFYFLTVIILGTFFCLYNFLNINRNQHLIFNSPDETANYYFSEHFQENNNFRVPSEYINISSDVHPRSIKASGYYLMPSSFIGLPLIYGSIAKIFGDWIIVYLTPIFALIGVIFLYLLTKKLFNQKVATISALLLLMLPSYWYFSAKSMMHNVLFMVLLLISLYYFLLAIQKDRNIYYLLFPFFLALSLMTRTSEILWISLIYLIILISAYQKISWQKMILSLIVLIISLTPLLYFNYQNQGSSLAPGYVETISRENSIPLTAFLEKVILPFGLHPSNIKFTIGNFIFKLVWFYNIFILIALITIIFKFKKIKTIYRTYTLAWVLLSLFLFIYYGSWLFYDNPTPTSITMGSSYLRYLLPYFVFAIPLMAWFISSLNFSKKWINNLITTVILIFIFIHSYLLVMTGPEEGLIKIKNDLRIYQNRTQKIIKHTEENAVIVTGRADKYIFPYRQVIYLGKEPQSYDKLDILDEKNIPIYYFGFTFKEDIEDYIPIFNDGDHSLYKYTND